MNGRKGCKGCKYYRLMTPSEKTCFYFSDTNEFRGCPVEQCDKYTKAPRKGSAKGAALFGEVDFTAV